jgi:hypothetical protein
MSLIGWILLGELLLVSVVGAVMAVVAAKLRQRRWVAAVAGLLDRARSGEARRIKELAGRCAESYRLGEAAAEQLARSMAEEEKRCTSALARVLLAEDLAAVKNLGDTLAKLADRHLTATAAALAERMAAWAAQPGAADVPLEPQISEETQALHPVAADGFIEAIAETAGAEEALAATEAGAVPGDSGEVGIPESGGLALGGESGAEDGADLSTAFPVRDGLAAAEPERKLEGPAVQEHGATTETPPEPAFPESAVDSEPEWTPAMARPRSPRRRSGRRPANPLWGIAPSDSGLPEDLAAAAIERAGDDVAAEPAPKLEVAEAPDPEAPEPAAKRRPPANPLYAIAPMDAGLPEDMADSAEAEPGLLAETAPKGEPPGTGVVQPQPQAGPVSAGDHSALADLEAALAEFEALLPVAGAAAPAPVNDLGEPAGNGHGEGG